MARFKDGLLGSFTGRAGNIVGSTWRGIKVVKAAGPSTRINDSPAQVVQQARFSLALRFVRTMSDLFGITFKSFADEMTPQNYAMRLVANEGKPNGIVEMELESDESAGTKKFYYSIGKLLQKFTEGGLFVSDEIDNNFHPSLLQQFIRFFNDPSINKAGAQLLFTSHDTNLLQPEILRRDQIYFAEKSLKEETILYSLADLKGIRNNADFARQYLAGFYGALPVLADYKNLSIDSPPH